MIYVKLASETDFDGWRKASRLLLQNKIKPCHIAWRAPSTPISLLDSTYAALSSLSATGLSPKVPSTFPDIAERVICHSDPERFARLYGLLFSMQTQSKLLNKGHDPNVMWLQNCDKAVRRDRHKMHAFVRFRKVGEGRFKREQFAAWFEPTHYITELAAPFFMRRFPNMDWVIVTPHRSAIWDGRTLRFTAGGQKADVPDSDAVEEQWKTYFKSIFNPARLKVQAMTSEMPKKYWKNLPEAVLIPDLISSAKEREQDMRDNAVTAAHPLAAKLSQRKRSEIK
jgi:DNA polymerase